MTLIGQKDIDLIKEALEELAPYTEEPIIYKQFDYIAQGDPVQGIPNETIYAVDTRVTSATAEDLSVEEIAVSGGLYVVGDMLFTLRRAAEPSYQDRIVYDDFTWKPISISKVFLGEVLWWEIKARKE